MLITDSPPCVQGAVNRGNKQGHTKLLKTRFLHSAFCILPGVALGWLAGRMKVACGWLEGRIVGGLQVPTPSQADGL